MQFSAKLYPPTSKKLATTDTISLPEGVRQGNENLVALSPKAAGKVQNLLEKEEGAKYLRLAIVGGGCTGLSYKTRGHPGAEQRGASGRGLQERPLPEGNTPRLLN
jgi:hypothetical protein